MVTVHGSNGICLLLEEEGRRSGSSGSGRHLGLSCKVGHGIRLSLYWTCNLHICLHWPMISRHWRWFRRDISLPHSTASHLFRRFKFITNLLQQPSLGGNSRQIHALGHTPHRHRHRPSASIRASRHGESIFLLVDEFDAVLDSVFDL